MPGAIRKRLSVIRSRDGVEIFTKMKMVTVHGITSTTEKEVKDYDFCLCDYCLKEIVMNRYDEKNKKAKLKWDERTGGIVTIPANLLGPRDLKMALHNECIKKALAECQNIKNER